MTSPNIMAIAEAAKKDAHRAKDLRDTIEGLESGLEAHMVRLELGLPSYIERNYIAAAAINEEILFQWNDIVLTVVEKARKELAAIEEKYEGVESKVMGQ